MGVLTVFMAFKEKNYVVFANEKDKAGMVRFYICFTLCSSCEGVVHITCDVTPLPSAMLCDAKPCDTRRINFPCAIVSNHFK